MCSSITGAPIRCAASICRRSAAMKIETRQPAVAQRRDEVRQPVLLPRHLEPALGGALLAPLGHQADRVRPVAERDRLHLGVAAISRLSGSVSAAISASMSASVMWRRSSRRCAVIPSAPAASASSRRAHRLGIGPAAGVPHRRDVVDVHAEPEAAERGVSGHVRVSLSGCAAWPAGRAPGRARPSAAPAARARAPASAPAAAPGRPRPAAASDSRLSDRGDQPRQQPADEIRPEHVAEERDQLVPLALARGRTRLRSPARIAAKAWAKASETRLKSRPLAPCPRMRRPSPSATGAINGKVSGLPTRGADQRRDHVGADQPAPRPARARNAARRTA